MAKIKFVPKESLEKLSSLKTILNESLNDAEKAAAELKEKQLIAKNNDLQVNLFIHQLYLEYGLSKEDRINNETGEIISSERDTEPPTEPTEEDDVQLSLFKKEEL